MRKTLYTDYLYFKMGIEYDAGMAEEPMPRFILIRYICFRIATFARALHCRISGHDLVDEGFAGPDSGCIEMVCKRCGYCYPTQWLY